MTSSAEVRKPTKTLKKAPIHEDVEQQTSPSAQMQALNIDHPKFNLPKAIRKKRVARTGRRPQPRISEDGERDA